MNFEWWMVDIRLGNTVKYSTISVVIPEDVVTSEASRTNQSHLIRKSPHHESQTKDHPPFSNIIGFRYTKRPRNYSHHRIYFSEPQLA